MMAIRNFWIRSEIEGRKTLLAGGPRSKTGEMVTDLFVKENGAPNKILRISCIPQEDGTLRIRVYNADHCTIFDHTYNPK